MTECKFCNFAASLKRGCEQKRTSSLNLQAIKRFQSRDQHLHACKFIKTNESVYIRKEINSHRTGLEHQRGHPFIVLEHQYGRRDVM